MSPLADRVFPDCDAGVADRGRSERLGDIASTIIAVYYTRYADKRKLRLDRQMAIFRDLMKTRGYRLHIDHVMALNLVPSDFGDDRDVMEKFKAYIEHLYRQTPANEPDSQRFNEEGEVLFGKLLVAVAKALRIKLDSEEARHFRYTPGGWISAELEQMQVRKLLINVLQGLTPIAIKMPNVSLPAPTPAQTAPSASTQPFGVLANIYPPPP